MDDPTETVKAVADATKSVAETTGKALDTAEKAGRWLDRLLGEDAGGALRDVMFYFRARNALKLQDKLDKLLEDRGVSVPKRLPLRKGIPFLDAATLEDEPTLQDRWARLIANAMDPDVDVATERSHASVLREFAPIDCIVLEKIADVAQGDPTTEITADVLAAALSRDLSTISVALCSLSRHSLVANKPKSGGAIGQISSWLFENSAFYLTAFGKQFVLACAETPGKWDFGDGIEASGESGELDSAPRWQAYDGE